MFAGLRIKIRTYELSDNEWNLLLLVAKGYMSVLRRVLKMIKLEVPRGKIYRILRSQTLLHRSTIDSAIIQAYTIFAMHSYRSKIRNNKLYVLTYRRSYRTRKGELRYYQSYKIVNLNREFYVILPIRIGPFSYRLIHLPLAANKSKRHILHRITKSKRAYHVQIEITNVKARRTYLTVFYEVPDPETINYNTEYYAGIDINLRSINVAVINSKEEPVFFKEYPIDLNIKSAEERTRRIGEVVKQIFQDLKRFKPIVFVGDIKHLYRFRPSWASIFAYKKIKEIIRSRAARQRISCHLIDESNTTKEARKIKPRGENIHNYAAMMIAIKGKNKKKL